AILRPGRHRRSDRGVDRAAQGPERRDAVHADARGRAALTTCAPLAMTSPRLAAPCARAGTAMVLSYAHGEVRLRRGFRDAPAQGEGDERNLERHETRASREGDRRWRDTHAPRPHEARNERGRVAHAHVRAAPRDDR